VEGSFCPAADALEKGKAANTSVKARARKTVIFKDFIVSLLCLDYDENCRI
jgi:hypothetical protein